MLRRPYLRLILAAGLCSSLPVHGQQNELRTLANSLAQDIADAGKKSIAVVDFTDLQGNPSELGRFLAEEFSVALARTHKGFEVIERNHLKAILSEHKLAATGLIDPATTQKLGQFAGADAIITGSMTPFSESVRVAVKVLATDTARIITADDVDLPKTKTIAELLSSSINQDGSHVAQRPEDMSAPPKSSIPAAQAPAPSSPVVVVDEFVYEVSECRGTGGSVRCSFRITNRGQDRDLTHNCDAITPNSNSSRAFDNLGNESPGVLCSMANHAAGQFNRGVSAHVVSGVAVEASMLFKNISPAATSLSLITLAGACTTDNMMRVSFRNVPIVR